jgi:hypothetical protein
MNVMKTNSMKYALMIFFVFSISIYNVNSQTKSLIRFDGLYQSETEDNSREFLRFYDDGTVLSVISSSNAKDLIKWFKKDKHSNQFQKGKYEINNNNIYFTTTDKYGTVVYQGAIDEYKLTLKTKSLINNAESTSIFYFIKFQ